MDKEVAYTHGLSQAILRRLDLIQETLTQKQKPFLDIEAASEYLGISKNTLYGYTSKGIIPYHKPQGRKIYFNVDDLNRFALDKANRVSSQSEISEKAALKLYENHKVRRSTK